jgi:hypothetical protein
MQRFLSEHWVEREPKLANWQVDEHFCTVIFLLFILFYQIVMDGSIAHFE